LPAGRLSSVEHIDDPRRYFFRVARNIVLEQVRRERVVRIEAASGLAVLEQGERTRNTVRSGSWPAAWRLSAWSA
jgi:DNA-directed RNA polymerase specialized sigma24 family protein